MSSVDLNLVLRYAEDNFPGEVMGINRIKSPGRNRFVVTYSNRSVTIDIEYAKDQRPSFIHIY